MRIWVLVIASALLVACASTRDPLPRDKQLDLQSKNYDGASQQKVIEAAARVLKFADKSDTTFQHSESGFRAARNYNYYAVFFAAFGSYHWRFEAEDVGDGVIQANVMLSQQEQGVYGTPTGAGGAQTTSVPQPGSRVKGPAIYTLFWSRLDYFLNQREQWPDCADWEKRIKEGDLWGSIDAFCGIGSSPERPSDAPDPNPSKNEEGGRTGR
jgi:hypothetical protein